MNPSNPEDQISLVDLQTGAIELHLIPVTSSASDAWTRLAGVGHHWAPACLRHPPDEHLTWRVSSPG